MSCIDADCHNAILHDTLSVCSKHFAALQHHPSMKMCAQRVIGQRNAIQVLAATRKSMLSIVDFMHMELTIRSCIQAFLITTRILCCDQVCRRGVWFHAGVAFAGSPPPGTLQTRLI